MVIDSEKLWAVTKEWKRYPFGNSKGIKMLYQIICKGNDKMNPLPILEFRIPDDP